MPHPNTISLRVSIVSYDSDEFELKSVFSSLLVSLARLTGAGYRCHTQLVLVDNSKNKNLQLTVFDEFSERLQGLAVELSLLKSHGNIGYGRGHNLAILTSDSKYHLILNPDVVLDPNCLTEGIRYLENNPQVAIVSPAATDREGKSQYLCRRYPTVFTLLIRGFFPPRMRVYFQQRLAFDEMHELPQDRPTAGIPVVSGCFMLCQTKSLLAVSGFDKRYFLYFEDFDLSLRIGKTAKLAYLPSMEIKHFGGDAAGKGFNHILMFIKSGWRFFNTHGWRIVK